MPTFTLPLHHNGRGSIEVLALPLSSTDMECSPERAVGRGQQSLREIALRLAEGLRPELIFPGSHYLERTRAELHKLMKQW